MGRVPTHAGAINGLRELSVTFSRLPLGKTPPTLGQNSLKGQKIVLFSKDAHPVVHAIGRMIHTAAKRDSLGSGHQRNYTEPLNIHQTDIVPDAFSSHESAVNAVKDTKTILQENVFSYRP
jgi:hypothetical protein